MKIRFLRDCQALREQTRCEKNGACDCCDEELPTTPRVERFMAGDEEDPERFWHKIHLTDLTYKIDYEIVEYP